MPVCLVTDCTNEAEDTHFVEEPEELSLAVCSTHGEAMSAGDDWVVYSQGPPKERVPQIRMGASMPWQVLAVSAARSAGSNPGLLLRLTLGRDGQSKDVELIVPVDEVEVLAAVLHNL